MKWLHSVYLWKPAFTVLWAWLVGGTTCAQRDFGIAFRTACQLQMLLQVFKKKEQDQADVFGLSASKKGGKKAKKGGNRDQPVRFLTAHSKHIIYPDRLRPLSTF